MPIRYDGNSIIRHNNIDYRAYAEYSEARRRESERLAREAARRNAKESYREWIQWCPPAFRNATIDSIGEHDPDVMRTLREAVMESSRTGLPCSLMIGSKGYRDNANNSVLPKGKTWAIYAYISELSRRGVITDPMRQVIMISEEDVLDKNTNWRDSGSFMKEVFDDDHRLVVVENINSDAGLMKRSKYGMDAWGRFINAADGREAGIIMSYSGDYYSKLNEDARENVGKLMSNAKEAILTRGVGA